MARSVVDPLCNHLGAYGYDHNNELKLATRGHSRPDGIMGLRIP